MYKNSVILVNLEDTCDRFCKGYKDNSTTKEMLALATIVMLLLIPIQACTEKATIEMDQLRCEYRENPVGLDISQPFLSWEMDGDTRDIRQKGYQILVASSMEKLNADEGDLWDSGMVRSDQSINIPYGGKSLESKGTDQQRFFRME